jgi:hypothetical protein
MKILAILICIGVASAQTSDTEARAVLGLEQTGASAASSQQNLFFDFFIDRELGVPWLSLWGDVQVASFPQQITTALARFNLVSAIGNLQVNQLAESGEFTTGIDVHPFKSWPAAGGTRRLGFVFSVGATGPYPPASRLAIFAVPSASSPQYANFIAQYPQAVNAAYIGFLPPDRESFYRSWAAGTRLTTAYHGRPAAQYTVTIGQDEQVTGGNLQGAVAKFDVFYPLPARIRGYSYLYLFGTADLRLARAGNFTPFILAPAPSNISGSDPSVAIVATSSERDLYRLGIGVDAVGLLCAIFQGECQ